MLRNYFKIAWRNIAKRKFYSLLNVFGLSTGIVFTLLISAYVWNELQVNKNLRNAQNQYFLKSKWRDPNQGGEITTVGPLAKRLKEDYPNLVANFYRWDGITSVISKGEKHFREGIQLGDSTVLKMYGFKLLHGDVNTALNEPYSVVIGKNMAIKYFGKTDVVGETLAIQSFRGTQREFAITGVLSDIAENSVSALTDETHNSIFVPTNTFEFFGRLDLDAWANIYIPSYIELKNGIQAKDLGEPIRHLLEQNAPDFVRQNLQVEVIPLTKYYLEKDGGLVKRMLYTLSFVGFFILLMAIINFINISISSSSARIREIGVRKVLGGLKKQIIFQFLVESLLLVLIATSFAVAIYPICQPLFSDVIGKQIPDLSSFPVYFVGIPAALVLLVGLMSGLYPALVLSSLNSVDSLKGQLKTIREKKWLRRWLSGLQFCISAMVIVMAVIVSNQVSYFFSRNLGYNKEYVVSSQVPRDWSLEGVRKMDIVRSEFSKMPQIAEAALSYEIPNGMNGGQPPVYRYGTDSTRAVPMQSMQTDGNYLSVYQIPLKAGSFFSNDLEADSLKVVLNEKAVQALGWKTTDDAIGQQLRIPGSSDVFVIKGVTKDFHLGSMQEKVPPIVFFKVRFTNTYRYLSFRIKPGDISNTIAAIEKKWAALLPGSSFEYRFMDEVLKKLYKTEIQLKKASYTATALSLIIVLLGVLGMVSLAIQKRTKEIGIRKVLGSSAAGIIVLFMKDFLLTIFIGGIVACPIAYVIMKEWLNEYAYRIPITAEPFFVSIITLGSITALLISIQTRKAANANPAGSLRTE